MVLETRRVLGGIVGEADLFFGGWAEEELPGSVHGGGGGGGGAGLCRAHDLVGVGGRRWRQWQCDYQWLLGGCI